MRCLVIYFSRAGENFMDGRIVNLEQGNAQALASFVQEATGADMFRVETVEEYPLDYTACTEVAKKELQKKVRPLLKQYLERLDDYSHVFVVGPCWWGTFPAPMFSQLERLDWKGKKVCILMSHEGSGLGNCVWDLKRICKGARFGKSLAIAGPQTAASRNQVQEWAKKQMA